MHSKVAKTLIRQAPEIFLSSFKDKHTVWSRKEQSPLETSKSDPKQKTHHRMKTMNTILQKTTY